jgi:hypothetical protein
MGGWKEIEYPLTEKAFCCEHCGNTTLMKEIANKTYIHTDANPEEMSVEQMKYTWMILVCCICNEVNIIEDSVWSDDEGEPTGEYDEDGDELWTRVIPTRKYLYKSSKDLSDLRIGGPQLQETYQDALKCFKLGLYTPTVIMCRKTVECLCVTHFRMLEPYKLSDKIERMLEKKYIDEMLYDWAITLNQFGNVAVHDFKTFNKNEAQNILDFTYALIEYSLNFRTKFKELKNNKKIKKTISQDSQESTDEVKVDTLSDSEVESLDKMLDDENELLNYYAAISLAKENAKIEKIVPILIEIYHNDKFKHLKNEIIKFLKKFGSAVVSELIKLLKDSSNPKNINRRIMAINTLGDLGSNAQEAIPFLIHALAEPDVKIQATHALIKLGSESVSSVITIYEEQLSSSDSSTS